MSGPPTRLRRIGPAIVIGLGLLVMAERVINNRSHVPHISTVPPITSLPHGPTAICLPRDTVLAALAARGIRARAETPAFCANPAGLTIWYGLDRDGPDGTHLAFDATGCLQEWSPAACP